MRDRCRALADQCAIRPYMIPHIVAIVFHPATFQGKVEP